MKKERTGTRVSKIRDWLISIREGKDMTQGAVANAAGIAQPSYYEIEKGISTPRPETAKKIAAALGFDWTKFYEDSDDNEEE